MRGYWEERERVEIANENTIPPDPAPLPLFRDWLRGSKGTGLVDPETRLQA